MSAATLWIYIPFLTGAVLLLFSGEKRFSRIVSLVLTAFLTITALRVPVNSMIVINRSSIIFSATARIFGRTITISRSDQTIIAFFYTFTFLWIFGSMFADVYKFFIPVSLMCTALMVAVISVQPFIYGIFFAMICSLFMLPMLRNTQMKNENIILRFLLYQLLGMIFLAVSGKMTGTLDINPQDHYLLRRTAVLIFIGLSLWLAVFPFFSWLVSLMEKGCPFVNGFSISLLQFSSLFILLEFLKDYVWLRTYEPLFLVLRIAGVIMLVIGAVMSMMQTNLQRMMAFIITAENGVSILLIGSNSHEAISTLLTGIFIHSVVWLIWATSVKFIGSDYDLSLDNLRGLVHQHPIVCAALILSHFTIAGMPLLAGFELRMSLFSSCFSRSEPLGWVVCIASAILLFSGIRLMFVFLSPLPENSAERQPFDERVRYRIIMRRGLLIVLVLLLVLISFFPSIMDIFMSGIREQYEMIFG